MIDAAGGMLAVVLRFVVLTATTGALGAWVFRRIVLPRLDDTTGKAEGDHLRRLADHPAIWCTAAIALASAARLTFRVLGGSAVDTLTNAQSLEYDWRRALAVQTIAATVACVALVSRRSTAAWTKLAEGALVVLAVTPPFLAHAGSAAEWRAVAVAVDVVHVVAAGGWVGALALVTGAAWRARRAPGGPASTVALIVAFHPVAVVAAPAVFVTGLLTAWLRMGVPEGIASPTYSGLFVVKLLLVGVTGYIGAGHSKLATKRAATKRVATKSVATGSPEAVGRTLLAECAVAVAVLLVTSVLVGTAPIG